MQLLDHNLVKLLNIQKTMKDSIPIGFLGGLIGTIAMDLSNIMFKKTGLSERTYAQYAGSILLNPFRLVSMQNRILGQILHLITGSVLGIPLFYVLKKVGKDNYFFKGAVYGTVTWELLYTFGQRFGVLRTKAYSTKTHFTTLIDNLVYGFISTATMVFLANPSVFPQDEKQVERNHERKMSLESNSYPMGESMYNYEDEVRIH